MADVMTGSQVSTPTLMLQRADDNDRLTIQKCKMLAISGPLAGQEFIVGSEIVSLGMAPGNDIIIKDPTISRRHCEIELTDEGYAIRDLASTNGTYVQGVRIQSAYLGAGTEFQIGSSRLVFCPLQETCEYRLSTATSFGKLVGQSVSMRHIFYQAERYASSDSTLLIEGETGTGKELLAEALHQHSARRHKPFIVIDCASLARELVASELFGHTKGAFTGALADREGAFEAAEGGTVFLDEVGDLAPELQPQLLRVLEKREIRRVGSNHSRSINVRILCATNKNLQEEVHQGHFREDLFYRLSVIRLELPPLRKRRDDIPYLAKRFMREFMVDKAEDHIAAVDTAARALARHNWPGNVRELRNLVEIACHSDQSPINLAAFLHLGGRQHHSGHNHGADRPFKVVKQEIIQTFEIDYITDLLKRHDGNVSQAARQAGIERAYLQRLVRKYGLRDSDAPPYTGASIEDENGDN